MHQMKIGACPDVPKLTCQATLWHQRLPCFPEIVSPNSRRMASTGLILSFSLRLISTLARRFASSGKGV